MTTRFQRIAIVGVTAPVVALGGTTMALAAPVSATHQNAAVGVAQPPPGGWHRGHFHHRHFHHRHFHHGHFHHRHFFHHRFGHHGFGHGGFGHGGFGHGGFGHGGFGRGYSAMMLTNSATIAGTAGTFTVSSAAK